MSRRHYQKKAGLPVWVVFLLTVVLVAAVGVGVWIARRGAGKTPVAPDEIETVAAPTAAPTPTSSPTPTPEPTPEPTPTPEPDQRDYTAEEAETVWDGNVLLVKQDEHWKALNLFGGGGGYAYIEALNTLRERVGGGVTIYSMPVPLNSQFYTPSNAREYTTDQRECFAEIHSQLDSAIVPIDLCPVFRKHTEEPIYLRTDTHWAQLGAYYAARTFAEAAGVEFDDISTYEKAVNEGYVGTMSLYTDSDRLENDPEDFTYYMPTNEYHTYYYDSYFNYLFEDDLFWDVSVGGSYLMYMGGDGYLVKIANPAIHNGRKLILLKDSYGNAEVPWLTDSFEEVFVLDIRGLDSNLVSFIRDLGVTDVLFSMGAYSVVAENSEHLMTLITQNEGEVMVDAQLSASAPEPETPDADA